MDYVLIIHDVKEYAAWKQIFDDAATIRKEAGEQSLGLTQRLTNNACLCNDKFLFFDLLAKVLRDRSIWHYFRPSPCC